IKILDYLRENSSKKINKSDVMRYMEDTSRAMTTHKIIMDLIKEGKIKMIKDKPHSQTHYLTINDENEFNRINQELSKMEKQIEKLQIPKAKKPRDVSLEDLITWHIVLNFGLINKFPTEDNEILYRKIARLLVMLALKKVRSMREIKEVL
ncbi:MAG: hypothetical protein WA932_06400, partial [Nitrososphaeraceae archaeon]